MTFDKFSSTILPYLIKHLNVVPRKDVQLQEPSLHHEHVVSI